MISPIGKNKRSLSLTGFTLLELVLVALIILILIGISTPVFRGTFYDIQLEETSYNITKFMNYARAKAITERVNTRLNFDFTESKYWLTISADPEDPENFTNIKGRLGRLYSVPSGVKIEGESPSVIFYPNGRSEDFELILTNKNDKKKSIEVKRETGQANISDNEE